MTSDGGIGTVFDAGADGFMSLAPLLWDRIGTETVRLAGVQPGHRVLDACCGAGSSALPAAEAAGPEGHVDAVDLSARLTGHGHRRAAAAGLQQLRFHCADVTAWRPPDGMAYDLALCLFGIFFLPDMDGSARKLASMLRPGGKLVITTWERGCLDAVIIPFAAAIGAHTGQQLQPPAAAIAAGRIATHGGLSSWWAGLRLGDARTTTLSLEVPLTGQQAWDFVTGAATRALLNDLSERQIDAVRGRYIAALAESHTSTLRARILVSVLTTT